MVCPILRSLSLTFAIWPPITALPSAFVSFVVPHIALYEHAGRARLRRGFARRRACQICSVRAVIASRAQLGRCSAQMRP